MIRMWMATAIFCSMSVVPLLACGVTPVENTPPVNFNPNSPQPPALPDDPYVTGQPPAAGTPNNGTMTISGGGNGPGENGLGGNGQNVVSGTPVQNGSTQITGATTTTAGVTTIYPVGSPGYPSQPGVVLTTNGPAPGPATVNVNSGVITLPTGQQWGIGGNNGGQLTAGGVTTVSVSGGTITTAPANGGGPGTVVVTVNGGTIVVGANGTVTITGGGPILPGVPAYTVPSGNALYDANFPYTDGQ